MEGRTRLAAGGFIVGTASIAAVAAVVMTNSAALADAPGTMLKASTVVVPAPASSAAAAASEHRAPSPVATIDPPVESVPVVTETETEASAPEDPTVTIVATAPSAATESAVVAAVAATGSWDSAYEWCKNHGWTGEQTLAWIARLEVKLEQYVTALSERPVETSGRDYGSQGSGSKKDRSPDSPDHSD